MPLLPREVKYILERVVDDGDCLIWQGATSRGYGTYYHRKVHILWWTHHYGPVPEGLELAHSCHRKNCISLEHVRPKTHKENLGETPWELLEYCKRGHKYDEENTYVHPETGKRKCKECTRMSVRKSKGYAV